MRVRERVRLWLGPATGMRRWGSAIALTTWAYVANRMSKGWGGPGRLVRVGGGWAREPWSGSIVCGSPRHQIQTRARAVQQGRQAKEQAGQCAGSVRREGEAVVRAGDRAEEMRGSGTCTGVTVKLHLNGFTMIYFL